MHDKCDVARAGDGLDDVVIRLHAAATSGDVVTHAAATSGDVVTHAAATSGPPRSVKPPPQSLEACPPPTALSTPGRTS